MNPVYWPVSDVQLASENRPAITDVSALRTVRPSGSTQMSRLLDGEVMDRKTDHRKWKALVSLSHLIITVRAITLSTDKGIMFLRALLQVCSTEKWVI